LTAVAEMNKQVQAQRENAYFATLFKGDAIEEVKPISRRGVRKAAMDFADKLLSGEIRAYYIGVEGGE
jgi:glutamine amidotransferase-like uncharacterized protein